ncbi:MAG: (2Fe-2S)-binding protein [Rhodopseudomonas sp.]|uniref:(2Fe-2S)-binding protein n=1 Tax=Rhodopseudomonas sp. TaxID=1078 RepID=UPI0018406C03|nr:(2Fe-2S)-binding protein [Rhodopseudomonas sp.]NVN88312.1 (2Fe-2S)-binding protein [Rhodopseudomonas sp.]
MTRPIAIMLTINAEPVTAMVESRLSLADFLRHQLRLTGTHVGCETGSCGACLVMQDGRVIHGCLTLAVQADGSAIQTIEGLSESGAIADLQAAFHERNALQCGFCTPGVLMTAQELLQLEGVPSREEIRDALSGNYCRCTGYQAIVDSIETTAQRRAVGEAEQPA